MSDLRVVNACYRRRSSISIRTVSHKLQWTKYRVRLALKTLGRKPYVVKVQGRLTSSQKLVRVAQLRKLLTMRRSNTILKNCWWSDESWFDLEGIVHKRQQRFWEYCHDDVPEIGQCRFPDKVMVWVAVSQHGVIGPYFFQGCVNALKYKECIEYFIDQLKRNRKVKNAVFMQDGASSHTAVTTRDLLNTAFPNRVIGKFFSMPWPPYSPDMNPMDFLVWKLLKKHVYGGGNQFESIAELKNKIRYEVKKLAKRIPLERLHKKVIGRFRRCVAQGGARI